MRVKLAVAAISCLLALTIGVPAAGAAPRDGYFLRPGHETVIHLQASNGYQLTIYRWPRFLAIEVHGPGVETWYSVRARKLGKNVAQASLPGFGAVAVRFAPSGPTRRLHPYRGCEGPGAEVQKGMVRGRIEFVGEGRYTEAKVDHASAEMISWTRQRCRYLRRHPRRHRRISASFLAEPYDGGGATFEARRFVAGVRPAGRQILFESFSGARVGRVNVSRSVFAVASASSFLFPDGMKNPEHVIFAPPSPFSGTGTLQRTAESTYTWEGSLSVKFPGIGPAVPLTGTQFNLAFCALRGCIYQYEPGEEESSRL